MKRLTSILFITLLVLAAFAFLFLAGGTLKAELSPVSAAATEYPQVFESIRVVLESGAAPQVFAEGVPDAPDGLRLEDVTITLSNRGIFDAEWVSVEVAPAPGDLAVYSLSGEGSTIRARTIGTINLKLLSRMDVSGPRTYRVQYYIYGTKRTVTLRQE